ncbi:MAG TPA: class I SAM-dependent methyltransferase [Phycisphaerae bacterium]|jgi:predicted O-methyltransferase YrrM
MSATPQFASSREAIPAGDYVSPGLQVILPDAAFPHMVLGDRRTNTWPYLRREIPHNWYVDSTAASIGFVTRDEASILYNTALQFSGKEGLEIGCWRGWSACHLLLGGVKLDIVDPVLADPEFTKVVTGSLAAAGVLERARLLAGYSPAKVHELARGTGKKWSLIFIDGNHEAPGPLEDAVAVAPYAEEDAAILFHDLSAPAVAEGLRYLKGAGWNVMVYMTMQIMGVAWRGKVAPLAHVPDPAVKFPIPEHLADFAISGMPERAVASAPPRAATVASAQRLASGAYVVTFGGK